MVGLPKRQRGIFAEVFSMSEQIYSFLLIGQSNMAGRGYLHEVEPIKNENIYVLRNGRWVKMFTPLHWERKMEMYGDF